MKAQSFEHQLRHAVAPAPDPEAQLRAQRAALAQFARIHGQEDAAALAGAAAAARSDAGGAQSGASGSHGTALDSPPARGRGKRESRWVLGWPLKSARLGGMATACVVVIGVSVVWLMPPKDRQINLHAPMVTPEAMNSEVTAGAGANARTASESAQPPIEQTGPADETTAASSSPEPSGAPDIRQPAVAPDARQLAAASGARQPATPPADAIAPAAAAQSATPTDELRRLAQSKERRAAEREVPTPMTTDKPVPARVPAPSGNADQKSSLNEVVVTGAFRSRAETNDSPNAVVAVEPENSELRIAPSRAQRSFFPASASASIAPAPAANEGRDKFQHFETNPVKRTVDDPVSTFSVDVDTAAYSFVRRKLNEGVLPQMDAVRVEEMINYFDYAWPASDSREQPFKPTITVSDSPWGAGKKLIHIGIKGYSLPASEQPDVNLVLLLDVSGSMASPDKLPLAQRSMALLLDSLRPTDTVAIVVYAGAAGEVLPPTPVSEKETILHALNRLQPGGSTAGAEGIRLAYALAEKSFRKGGVNRILLATDGDFNVGITDHNELKSFVAREREKGVYLSVLGFGQGNYRDEMAQTLAQNGNGVAAYIDTLNEAKKVLVQEATSSLFPIAKDVKLQVEFNPATVAEYRLVGYETRALNREDFNNDKVDAGDVGSGHSVTAIYEITPVGSDAKLIDERRYAAREERSAARGKASEYGFLKIRYKLPNGFRSRLLEQPIRMDAGVPPPLRDDVSFSTAVAGFAQLLRGSQYVGSLSFEDVVKQAQAGMGADPFGYRAEFVRLVSQAQQARGM